MRFWKETRARTPKECDRCGAYIDSGELYYRERLKDPRINFIGKKSCVSCYKEYKK